MGTLSAKMTLKRRWVRVWRLQPRTPVQTTSEYPPPPPPPRAKNTSTLANVKFSDIRAIHKISRRPLDMWRRHKNNSVVYVGHITQWRIQGGRIGRGPPFFGRFFFFFFVGLFWPIFGRGIEEFGFPAPPPPPFHRSWIRHCNMNWNKLRSNTCIHWQFYIRSFVTIFHLKYSTPSSKSTDLNKSHMNNHELQYVFSIWTKRLMFT